MVLDKSLILIISTGCNLLPFLFPRVHHCGWRIWLRVPSLAGLLQAYTLLMRRCLGLAAALRLLWPLLPRPAEGSAFIAMVVVIDYSFKGPRLTLRTSHGWVDMPECFGYSTLIPPDRVGLRDHAGVQLQRFIAGAA